ncbi:hypothetical protein HDU77_006130 [Chytriomyces hyalinus]|nr:hypothetical protein HDU77_006130 [Chytriomyces hyalinus]
MATTMSPLPMDFSDMHAIDAADLGFMLMDGFSFDYETESVPMTRASSVFTDSPPSSTDQLDFLDMYMNPPPHHHHDPKQGTFQLGTHWSTVDACLKADTESLLSSRITDELLRLQNQNDELLSYVSEPEVQILPAGHGAADAAAQDEHEMSRVLHTLALSVLMGDASRLTDQFISAATNLLQDRRYNHFNAILLTAQQNVYAKLKALNVPMTQVLATRSSVIASVDFHVAQAVDSMGQ